MTANQFRAYPDRRDPRIWYIDGPAGEGETNPVVWATCTGPHAEERAKLILEALTR